MANMILFSSILTFNTVFFSFTVGPTTLKYSVFCFFGFLTFQAGLTQIRVTQKYYVTDVCKARRKPISGLLDLGILFATCAPHYRNTTIL